MVDVKIETADEDLFAHRVVLGAYSQALLDIFSNHSAHSMVNLELHNVSSDDCKKVLKFLYTADISLTDENIQGILHTSIRLQMEALQKMSYQYLNQYSEKNAFSYYAICINNNLIVLAAKIWRFICEQFEALCDQGEFEKLLLHQAIDILSDNRLRISSEVVVVNSVLMWVRKNPHQISDIWDILGCVRFPLLTPEQLLRLETHPYLSTIPGMPEKIHHAMW